MNDHTAINFTMGEAHAATNNKLFQSLFGKRYRCGIREEISSVSTLRRFANINRVAGDEVFHSCLVGEIRCHDCIISRFARFHRIFSRCLSLLTSVAGMWYNGAPVVLKQRTYVTDVTVLDAAQNYML